MNKKKIDVEICVGTTCYVMGASELMLVHEKLTPEELEWVNIKGTPCLDACLQKEGGKAPFVKIDGEILDRVDEDVLISKIKTLVAERKMM